MCAWESGLSEVMDGSDAAGSGEVMLRVKVDADEAAAHRLGSDEG